MLIDFEAKLATIMEDKRDKTDIVSEKVGGADRAHVVIVLSLPRPSRISRMNPTNAKRPVTYFSPG